jgi:hypothetical protein
MTYLARLEKALTDEFKSSTDKVDQRLCKALRELAQLLDGLDHLNIEKQPE